MPWDPRGVVRFPSEGPGNQHPTPRARLRRPGPPAALAGAGGARGLPGRGRRHARALPRCAARGGPPRSRERPDRARPPPGARPLARAPRRGSEAGRERGAPAHAAVGSAHQHDRAGGIALERLRARTPHQPVSSGGRADELRRFYNLFPPASELTDDVERLHRLARSSGLDLAQGEYRLERRASGLWAYRVTLPVRGSYAQLRGFLGVLLTSMPTASIDALRFERKKAADTQLEAQVRVTLHARPSGDTL